MYGFLDELEKAAAKKSFVDKMQPLTPAERAAANRRYAEAKKGFGSGDGCSPGKTKEGYNFHTHRARTESYPSFDKIPIKRIQFVASTA
jgi:hypothetical protein